MKRLISERFKDDLTDQEIEDIDEMETWIIGDRTTTDDEIDKILNKNQDCTYSGTLYRIMAFYNLSDISNYEKLKQQIWTNGYMSFTKSYNWVLNEAENGDVYEKENSVIIRYNGTGLDVNKFIDKYSDFILHNNYYMQNYKYQQEVITKISHDYDIIYVGGKSI